MSSTAIVFSSLQKRGQLKTPAGQATFSVFLFQDIAVIPILVLLPLLAVKNIVVPLLPGTTASTPEATGHTASLIGHLPGRAQTLAVLLAVSSVIFPGRHLVNVLFRAIARTSRRELLTPAALPLVSGVPLVMQPVRLSAALGPSSPASSSPTATIATHSKVTSRRSKVCSSAFSSSSSALASTSAYSARNPPSSPAPLAHRPQ